MSSRYEVTLNSGRDIYLDQLFQYRTYSGLVEGLPTPNYNENLIQRALEYSKTKLWCQYANPFLIVPIQIPIDLSDKQKDKYFKFRLEMPSKLPEMVSLASFESYQPARDKNAMGSILGIVWFQDTFGLPTDEIVEQMKLIDWENLAYDHEGD